MSHSIILGWFPPTILSNSLSSVKLSANQEKLDEHMQEQYKDSMRDQLLPLLLGLRDAPEVKFKFDASWIKKKDFDQVLRSRRNGPNGIP